MFSAAIGEIKNNLRILKRNSELLSQELVVLPQGRIMVNPFGLLRTGAWDLMKIHYSFFLINNDLLPHVNSSDQLVEEINEIVRSRELYRQNNSAMSSYKERMIKYDQLLIEQSDKLLKVLTDLDQKTAKFIQV